MDNFIACRRHATLLMVASKLVLDAFKALPSLINVLDGARLEVVETWWCDGTYTFVTAGIAAT